jgi:drug/metabolite transporter (DMT)-like permease
MITTRGLVAHFSSVPAPVRGAFYMVVAAFGFTLMNMFIRIAAVEMHPFQIAFFRNFFALIFMLPWLANAGLAGLRTQRLGTHILRSMIGITAMLSWFSAVVLLPLGEAVALNFTVPMFATAGAALILRETVGVRRWGATVVGFLGVLIVLRPGFAEITPAMALPVVAALFMAGSVLLVKSLSRTENPAAIVFYLNLFLTPLSLGPALFVWQWPSWPILAALAALGGFALFSHLFLTRAFSLAEASAIIPFDYARLPFIVIMAYLAFGEVPSVWIWPGSAVIASAAIYIARREAKVARLRAASGAAARSPQAQI